jgi:hypothetical protein
MYRLILRAGILLLATTVGATLRAEQPATSPFDQVKLGQTREEVHAVMGLPSRTVGLYELWETPTATKRVEYNATGKVVGLWSLPSADKPETPNIYHASCPIEFQKVDPHSIPLTSGLLGSDADPWDHYLRIEYKNISDKTIIAIRFGVSFVDAMAEAKESVYSYDSSAIVKPGKTEKPYWGDGVYFHQYGYRMSAIAWLEKVRFADNTFFVDDGSHSCESQKQETQRVMQQTAANSKVEQNSPAALAAAAVEGRVLSRQEIAERIQNGEASVCSIATIPPGAEVDVDGNKGGITPLVFFLFKRGDTPRTVTIKMSGYKTVEKQFVPDGKNIVIGLVLTKGKGYSK